MGLGGFRASARRGAPDQGNEAFEPFRLLGRKQSGSNPSLGGSHPSAPAASMDATHGPNRGCNPLRLLRPTSGAFAGR